MIAVVGLFVVGAALFVLLAYKVGYADGREDVIKLLKAQRKNFYQ